MQVKPRRTPVKPQETLLTCSNAVRSGGHRLSGAGTGPLASSRYQYGKESGTASATLGLLLDGIRAAPHDSRGEADL